MCKSDSCFCVENHHNTKLFYIVWSPWAKRNPMKKHDSLISARTEAKRLAEKEKIDFYVMKSVVSCTIPEVVVTNIAW